MFNILPKPGGWSKGTVMDRKSLVKWSELSIAGLTPEARDRSPFELGWPTGELNSKRTYEVNTPILHTPRRESEIPQVQISITQWLIKGQTNGIFYKNKTIIFILKKCVIFNLNNLLIRGRKIENFQFCGASCHKYIATSINGSCCP